MNIRQTNQISFGHKELTPNQKKAKNLALQPVGLAAGTGLAIGLGQGYKKLNSLFKKTSKKKTKNSCPTPHLKK